MKKLLNSEIFVYFLGMLALIAMGIAVDTWNSNQSTSIIASVFAGALQAACIIVARRG